MSERADQVNRMASVLVTVVYRGQSHTKRLAISDEVSRSFVHSLLTEAVEKVRSSMNEDRNADYPGQQRVLSASTIPAPGQSVDFPNELPDTIALDSPIIAGKWYREHTADQLRRECDRRELGIPRDVGNDVAKLADLLNHDDQVNGIPNHVRPPVLDEPSIALDAPPLPPRLADDEPETLREALATLPTCRAIVRTRSRRRSCATELNQDGSCPNAANHVRTDNPFDLGDPPKLPELHQNEPGDFTG